MANTQTEHVVLGGAVFQVGFVEASVSSRALAQGVFQAATIQDAILFSYAEGLNNSLQALTSPDEITSFVVKEGWPETYTSTAV